MSELNKKIENLIKKAKETGDLELLELATDLLSVKLNGSEQDLVKKAKKSPNNQADEKYPEFSMNSESKMKQPVEVVKRSNLYEDKGEHKDSINQTPTIELTERRRPSFKKVDQTCQKCSRVVKVNPSFARDFFTCDSCLRR